MEFSPEFAILHSCLQLSNQTRALESYNGKDLDEEQLNILHDTVYDIIEGLQSKHTFHQKSLWKCRINGVLFVAAFNDKCPPSWLEYYDSVLFGLPPLNDVFYFAALMKCNWLEDFLKITSLFQEKETQLLILQKFLDFIKSLPEENQKDTIVELNWLLFQTNLFDTEINHLDNFIQSLEMYTLRMLPSIKSVDCKLKLLAAMVALNVVYCKGNVSVLNVITPQSEIKFDIQQLEQISHDANFSKNFNTFFTALKSTKFQHLSKEVILRHQIDVIFKKAHTDMQVCRSFSKNTHDLSEEIILSIIQENPFSMWKEHLLNVLSEDKFSKSQMTVWFTVYLLNININCLIKSRKTTLQLFKLADFSSEALKQNQLMNLPKFELVWFYIENQEIVSDEEGRTFAEMIFWVTTVHDTKVLYDKRWIELLEKHHLLFECEVLVTNLLKSRSFIQDNDILCRLTKLILSIFDALPIKKKCHVLNYINKSDVDFSLGEQDDFHQLLTETINKLVSTDNIDVVVSQLCSLYLQSPQALMFVMTTQAISDSKQSQIIIQTLQKVPEMCEICRFQNDGHFLPKSNNYPPLLLQELHRSIETGVFSQKQEEVLINFVTQISKAMSESEKKPLMSITDIFQTCIYPIIRNVDKAKNRPLEVSKLNYTLSVKLLHSLLHEHCYDLSVETVTKCNIPVVVVYCAVQLSNLNLLWDDEDDGSGIMLKEIFTDILVLASKIVRFHHSALDAQTILWLKKVIKSLPSHICALMSLDNKNPQKECSEKGECDDIVLKDLKKFLKDKQYAVVLLICKSSKDWYDAAPQLFESLPKTEATYVGYMCGLVQVLPHCLVREAVNIWMLVETLLKMNVISCPRIGMIDRTPGIQIQLSQMLLDTILLLVKKHGIDNLNMWRHITRQYVTVIQEIVISNKDITISLELLHHMVLLFQKLPCSSVEQMFVLFLDILTDVISEEENMELNENELNENENCDPSTVTVNKNQIRLILEQLYGAIMQENMTSTVGKKLYWLETK